MAIAQIARLAIPALAAALAVALALVGALLTFDRPGLEAEYFALVEPWQGKPVYTTIGEPHLESTEQIHDTLLTPALFSIRWSGWWDVPREGRYRFVISADDGGYLRIDGETVIDSKESPEKGRWTGRRKLGPGLHTLEIGYYQAFGSGHFTFTHTRGRLAEATPAALSPDTLFSGRPLLLRRVLRSRLASWSRPYRQLLGVALLIAAFFAARKPLAPLGGRVAGLGAKISALANGKRGRGVLLLGLFLAAFCASLPLTGTIRGGDDTAYLTAAHFNLKSWFFNRYAHVYLVKLFITLTGGDPLSGVRVWWSFVFASTVAALGVATASIGPKLQVRTLAVVLFILLSQASLLGLIGAGFADFSAMMFITIAIAIYLHALARPPDASRLDWHPIALGALAVAAFRSKEVGAILMLPPLFFVVECWLPEGALARRFDWRRLGRRMTLWVAGAAALLLGLVALDAILLGDAFFTFDSGRLAKSGSMNFPEQLEQRRATATWLQTVVNPGGHPATLALRHLWIGVLAAAVAAGFARRRLEHRLVHLVPIAYFLALIVLYTRMSHPFSTRMMIPILPTASLVTGLMAHYAGLDEMPWRKLFAPRILVPLVLAAAALWLVVIPFQLGSLAADEFLPAAALSRFGWAPEVFAGGMAAPALVLIAVGLASLVPPGRRARIAVLLILFLAAFGPGLEYNRKELAKKTAAQKGELLLYPWRAFRNEIGAAKPASIALSTDLHTRYRMSGTTRSSIAGLVLERQGLEVFLSHDLPGHADIAIASFESFKRWHRANPSLGASATTGPLGFLVLVRPKEALDSTAPVLDAETLPSPPQVSR